MADLEITADFSSVTQGEKKVVQLERQLSRLIKRFDSGAVESDAFRQGLISLKREYSELGVSIQKASGQVEKYVRQTQKANAEQQKAARQKEWFAQQRRRIQMMEESRRMEERQTRESVQAQSQQERAAKSHADELERLARRYRPLYAASKLYENELNDVNRAHKEGVINARQHASAVDQLNQEYMDFQNGVASATNRFRGSMVGSTRSLNDFGMATQQVGYQVGDFLVQVQSGTNAFVAFGQQATQLVGILPMFASQLKISAGTLVGISAGLGIAIPLVTAIAAAFFRMGDAAEDSAEGGLKDLEDRYNSITTSVRQLKRERLSFSLGMDPQEFDLVQKVEEAEEAYQDAIRRRDEFFRQTDVDGLGDAIGSGLIKLSELAKGIFDKDTLSQFESAEEALVEASSILNELRGQLQDIQQEAFDAEYFGLKDELELQKEILQFGEQSAQVRLLQSNQQIDAFNRELALKVKTQEITQGQADTLARVFSETVRLEAKNQSILDSLTESGERSLYLQQQLGLSADAANRLSQTDIASGVVAASRAAQTLAKNMDISLRAALAMSGMIQKGIPEDVDINDPRDPRFSSPEFKSERLRKMIESGELYNSTIDTTGGSSGGSSGGGSPGAEELTNLEKLHKAQEEAVQEHLDNIEAMEKGSLAVRFGAASDYFSDLISLSGSSNEKLLGISKAFAAAEATVNAYKAYTAALGDQNITVFGRLAAGAKVLAAGLGAVNAIRGIGKNGGGGSVGSSGGGSIATPQGQTQAPQRILIEGLDPSALYSGDMIQSIFDAIYDENEERGAVFMVAT